VDSAAVVLDSCVLYPAQLRSLFLYLATAGLFRARWTDAIHEEWMRTLLREYPDVSRAKAERVRDLMDAAVPDCLVVGYEYLTERLTLPDASDRHVLAAAIHAGASAVVTFNLSDFPAAALAPHAVAAVHPDEFVAGLLATEPAGVCDGLRRQRLSLKNPSVSVAEFLAGLERCQLPRTVSGLRACAGRL
jgi:hypothetical protein